MSKASLKFLIYITIFIVVSVFGLMYAFNDIDIDGTFNIVKNANVSMLGVSLLMLIVYIGIEVVQTKIITNHFDNSVSWWKITLVILIGHFFLSLTPLGIGGAIIQVALLSAIGLRKTEAIAVITIKWATAQVALIVFSFATVLPYLGEFNTFITDEWGSYILFFGVLGMIMNVVLLVLVFVISYSRRVQRLIFNFIIDFLAKIKIFKDKEEKKREVNLRIEEFKESMSFVFHNKAITAFIVVILCARLFIFSSQSFVLAYALSEELQNLSLGKMMAMSQIIQTANRFVPTPGATGTTEISFIFVLESMIEDSGSITTGISEMSTAIMIMWRLFTFYFQMLLGFIAFTIYNVSRFKLSFE